MPAKITVTSVKALVDEFEMEACMMRGSLSVKWTDRGRGKFGVGQPENMSPASWSEFTREAYVILNHFNRPSRTEKKKEKARAAQPTLFAIGGSRRDP